jgi:hypothetical protein
MPYPNEHACRLRDPGDFMPNSFRRVTRKSATKKGKQYSVIRGRLRGSGNWQDQAYRYSKGSWKSSEARSHCKSHKGKTFEAASGGQND